MDEQGEGMEEGLFRGRVGLEDLTVEGDDLEEKRRLRKDQEEDKAFGVVSLRRREDGGGDDWWWPARLILEENGSEILRFLDWR